MRREKLRRPRGVDFSESTLSDLYECKNCAWPTGRDIAFHQPNFHIVGKWGEQTKCGDPEPDYKKPWVARRGEAKGGV